MTTTTRQAIAQSLNVIKELDADEATEPATITVLHLGHPSDAKYGTFEMMTPEQYEKFKWLHTWPRPQAARDAIAASERERRRVQGVRG